MKVKKAESGAILAEIAVKGMQEKKAKSVVKIDLRKLNSCLNDPNVFKIIHSEAHLVTRIT